LAVYVDIPDFEDLEARLRRRATESEEKIQQRLAKARSEREYRSQFDTILMNANLEISLKETLELATNFLKK
jgi:guanylate kinase